MLPHLFYFSQGNGEAGSSNIFCGRANKSEKTRRSWTYKEEEVLLASLKELVANGWKANNGFRAGYLSKLEYAMGKAFPDTDLKGMPHINSKISSWKKSYNSLMSMVQITGVGFSSNGTFMIDCDNDQWDTIMKKDANAKGMHYKAWPMFEAWKEVFGKDRATGEQAEDVMDAYNEMIHNNNVAEARAEGHINDEHDETNVDTEAGDSTC
ncbi:uncharacterized protein LOC130990358 [Salvia miltiorrhiza]|uniref:uncharacterized protein LOC130990358 n=1 Tax=Salvia miltiorrhiza TaxID=226208 RepID=UPI0025ACCA31|nr:uncharacterized protein LOC130990358 [Salvia miltiorrhiza]